MSVAYTPIGAKILLKELVYDRRSGIILPNGTTGPVVRCEVMAVGPGYLQADGRYLECQIKVGDHIYIPRAGVMECEFNRYKYLMTDEARVLVVIDQSKDVYSEPPKDEQASVLGIGAGVEPIVMDGKLH